MQDVLGYRGKTVVITGCATGMGASAAEMLVELGAEVWGLDLHDVKAPIHRSIRVDMKDKATLDAAIAELPREIDVLFNCAGVPSPPMPPLDALMINFVGLRHLTDALLPRIRAGGAIASIASTAGMGWKSNLPAVREFLALGTFDAAAADIAAHPEKYPDGYGFAKQCIIVYTQTMAGELCKRNVRINCIAPSPTGGVFMENLTTVVPEAAIKPFTPANGQVAEPADMGKVMVLLGSDLASFVSGVNLPVDYGYCAEVAMGQRDNLMNIS
ncbi:MAG: coniferyl-alcohol dehydrogenase [Spirochaetaceae bacterium]|nr:coniferyl-alcohol dehydrogenase [Myxococcales bacterium]MCB9722653.1 coniferyl-alcohol dehydrogenase [Spirochaetaceae bacterium]HPG27681.1 coniferyl-alcohol dehydrogenase [Myxococcota bacterium]